MKRTAKAIIVIALSLAVLSGGFFMYQELKPPKHITEKAALPGGAAWTATPYMTETGKEIPGLEEAVKDKLYWLETTQPMPATITVDEAARTLVFENGAMRRVLHLPTDAEPFVFTQSLKNTYINQELLDGTIAPEAIIGLYDKGYREIYSKQEILLEPEYFYVGGSGEPSQTFQLTSYEIIEGCEKPFEWTPHPVYGDPAAGEWPPRGMRAELYFAASPEMPAQYQGVNLKIIYELYDNLAAMKKRVEITNETDHVITVGRLAAEILHTKKDTAELLSLETSYTGGNEGTIPFNSPLPCGCANEAEDSPLHALKNISHACYEAGPAYQLEPRQRFAAFDCYELLHSTFWFELRAREQLGMYRKLFPWITDNPLTFHATLPLSREVIDHAANAGFEMVIQSFSVAEDRSQEMMATDQVALDYYKELIAYAHSKGVAIGIYQAQYLLDQYKTSAAYGKNGIGQWNTWCLASAAFDDYFEKFIRFVEYTGIDCVEIDGPYPNCYCDNGELHQGTEHSQHAVHYGYFDSQVKQWENATRLLCKTLRDLGVYIKVPAWYYMNGGNKCGIGYEEIAWSQPRQEQLIYARQIIHNGSYARTMAMSWTHVPFAEYHGGGSKAAFFPFKKNPEDYNWVAAQCLGNGLTSDFRGTALYDEATEGILQTWTAFYKQHRAIVNADLVHVRQAQFRKGETGTRTNGIDVLFHADANTPGEKGLLWVYNQTDEIRTAAIEVPMYYTGLTDLPYPQVPVYGSLGKDVHTYGEYPPNYDWLPQSSGGEYRLPDITGESRGQAVFVDADGNRQTHAIDSNGNVLLEITLQPMQFTWLVLEAAE